MNHLLLSVLVGLALAAGCAAPRPAANPGPRPGPPVREWSPGPGNDPPVWKLLPYFERVRELVTRNWDPKRAINWADPAHLLGPYPGLRTRLTVTLHDDGRLKSITVRESSGRSFIDRCAIEAFEKTEPFPPPPPDLHPGGGDFTFTMDLKLE